MEAARRRSRRTDLPLQTQALGGPVTRGLGSGPAGGKTSQHFKQAADLVHARMR